MPVFTPLSPGLLLTGLVAAASVRAAAPCDIYAAGGAPCVAAHSTTRALFDAYRGPLYQVERASDHTTRDIQPKFAGGVANAVSQDSFCARTTCLITIIYDQSGKGNHLTQAPGGAFPGPAANGFDNLASATGAPVMLNGEKVYGVFIAPGTGYRVKKGKDVATGDEAQGMYAVFDGTHFNGGCCFDYGNAETSSTDTGPGSMEAIYFGNCNVWGKGSGPGPWVMADLENGLFSGASPGLNAQNPTISHRFISTAVKGEPGRWVIKGGDACAGTLSTFYDGARPSVPGYNPMKKEGSIILGTGGDNSHGAQGTFYEGVMTRRLPRDETEALVQANIVAAKYSAIPWTKRSLAVGQVVTLRVMTPGHTARYIAHLGPTVNTQVITPSSTMATQNLAKWTIVEGLGRSGCYSFESVDTPGSYIRHDAFSLKVHADNGTKEFREDATFCQEPGFGGTGHSFRLWSHPTRYLRHHGHVGYAASNGGREVFDRATSFTDDATFVMGTGFA